MKKINENRKRETTHNKSSKCDTKTPDKRQKEITQSNSPKTPMRPYSEKTNPTITNIYKKASTEERIRR